MISGVQTSGGTPKHGELTTRRGQMSSSGQGRHWINDWAVLLSSKGGILVGRVS